MLGAKATSTRRRCQTALTHRERAVESQAIDETFFQTLVHHAGTADFHAWRGGPTGRDDGGRQVDRLGVILGHARRFEQALKRDEPDRLADAQAQRAEKQREAKDDFEARVAAEVERRVSEMARSSRQQATPADDEFTNIANDFDASGRDIAFAP